MKRFFLFFFLVGFFVQIFSSEFLELDESYEVTNYKMIQFLNKITDSKVKTLEKTRGFDYRYQAKWYTPYNYDIFIGRYNNKSLNSIIRIESNKRGEEKVYKQILEQELLRKELDKASSNPIQTKSHLISQSLNLISPIFSISYNAKNSPLFTFEDALLRSSKYFLADILVVAGVAVIAKSTLKKRKQVQSITDPLGKGPDYTLTTGKFRFALLGGLLLSRFVHSFSAYEDVGTQNRLAEIGYTLQF